MSVAVPRAAEARVGGLTRARLGALAADAMQAGARRQALGEAQAVALELVSTSHGLAEWCELAAANVDMSARCLLEVIGQGGRGVCRSRAWILRNGARIRKGERGLAVSMFGAYVWPLRSSTGNFGSVGLAAEGEAPADVLAGYAMWAGADPIAGAILAAMRGYRLARVGVSGDVTADRLDAALARARGVAWHLPACLSCDGVGCVLCSCADDRCRQPMVNCDSMATPEPLKRKRGGQPKTRPEIPEVSAAMQRAATLRARADQLLAEADADVRTAMVKARKAHSFGDIAHASGLSRARVHQIVEGRSDRK